MRINKLRTFLLGLCCSISFVAMAQNHEVRGTVYDSDNEPVIGASVVIKGTTTGVYTDTDGNYKLSLKDPNSTLVISFVGYDPAEISVEGRSKLTTTLYPSANELEEVVAIGYGSTARRDLTGSISSVKSADMAKVPVADAAVALGGRVAGVQVTQASGSPDAELTIKVRGGTSITQSNEPLYIIDGFPSDDGLRGIDASDIATLDVLKDASATAIYGARGANGVVLITTKGGKTGKVTVTYDMYYGVKKINKYLDVLNVEDYVRLDYERSAILGADDLTKFANNYGAFADIGSNYASRAGIDWQKEVFDKGTTTQFHKIGISGGDKNTRYNISFTLNDDGGIMRGSGLSRNSIRSNFSHKATDKLSFSTKVSYTRDKTTGIGSLTESGSFSRMVHIIQYRPTVGIKNGGDDSILLTEDSDPLFDELSGNQLQNPITSIEAEDRTKQNKYLNLNASAEYKILPNLIYRGSVGLNNRMFRQDEFYNSKSRQAKNSGGPYGSIRQQETNSWTYNNTLTLDLKPYLPKAHAADIMVGQEDYSVGTKLVVTAANNFPEDNFGTDDMSLGITPSKPTTTKTDERLISFFGRVNYTFLSRYMLSATLRADGSSKFGKNNKWGYFPSASFAWRASDENFIKSLGVFSNLKVRASIGTSGNNRISNYLSLSLMESSWMPNNNESLPSYYPAALNNSDLKWETTTQRNLGFDFGFFDQRISLVVDLYWNSTKDLLLNTNIPGISGYTNYMKNIGKTENKGAEFTLNTVNIRNGNSGFEWTTSFNISMNRNKVVALADADFFTRRSGWVGTSEFNYDDYIVRVGESLGQMYGYKLAGIYTADDFKEYNPSATGNNPKYILKDGVAHNSAAYPSPGSWKFEDTNKDGKIDEDDMTVIGNANPDFFGGITNTFTYKGFDLTIFCNFSFGNQVYNANKMYYTKTNLRLRNSLDFVNDRFTYIDADGTKVAELEDLARINQGRNFAGVSGSANLLFHSGYVENGSFFRINNITLGYTFPEKWMSKVKVSTLRIYASVYNLHNFTSYSGYDPEVNVRPNGGLTPGIDWGAYPRSLSFVFGANIAF